MVIPSGIIPFVNFIVIGFVVISVVIGYKKGFVVQIFHLLGIVAAILVSWYFSPILAEKYEIFPQNLVPFAGTGFENMFYGRLNALLWHAALFFGALLLIFLIKPLMKALTELPVVRTVNRLFGALFALIPAALVLVMTAYFFSTPLVLNGQEVLDNSVLGPVHIVSENTLTLLKEPLMTQESIRKIINGDSLTQDDLRLLWNWMKTENADPEKIREFLTQFSGGTPLPGDLNQTEKP
ncbi:MAG: CvpA family protein [Erysipelotrichales bacterium]|nr:CvpA family protein [Erysipelotrichales bacterium]MBQ2309323.1 CvpA family protein [Erysipelotrichales bacterium]MBQ4375483.1 CvpA family protein [Erysipelotrichales bacterium]